MTRWFLFLYGNLAFFSGKSIFRPYARRNGFRQVHHMQSGKLPRIRLRFREQQHERAARQGGSARGYRNKYLKLVHEIRNAYGMSVVCSSTPDTEINQTEHAMQALTKEGLLTADTRIYFVGFSKGASIEYSSFSTTTSNTARWQTKHQWRLTIKKTQIGDDKYEYWKTVKVVNRLFKSCCRHLIKWFWRIWF